MHITELLNTNPDQQSPNEEMHDSGDKLKISDFLQYPTLDEPESISGDIELRVLREPDWHPQAALLIARLVEATGTLEVLEVLHDAYQMYCDGELVIDIEADEWPYFWDEVLN